MVCRKRQRPCASDFFDQAASTAPAVEKPAEEAPPDFTQHPIQAGSARAEEYISVLNKFSERDQALELIRGKDVFDFNESCETRRHLYIVKANDYEGKMRDRLHLRHVATLLWGPGKRHIAGGLAIYSTPLSFKGNETLAITTEDIYTIEFSCQRLAELACELVEYHLNQFMKSLEEEDNSKPLLLVQTKVGSDRWLVKDPKCRMTEANWKVIRKQIPLLRPLPKPKLSSPQVNIPIQDQLAFEIFQLPPSFDIPQTIDNLLQLKLLALPYHIKLTKEAQSDTPVRILLRFTERTSAVICKINLYKLGFKDGNGDKIRVFIDGGDSSIDDTWQRWFNAVIWDEQQIQSFVQSRTRQEGARSNEDIDELEEEKKVVIGPSESQELEEFFETSDESADSDTLPSRPPRRTSTRTYLKSLLARQAQIEKVIQRLTLKAEEEFLANQALDDAGPKSEFYRVSEQVNNDKKYAKLMKQIERKRVMRRKLKNYRKIKELPEKIKQQRKQWRREQRARFREGAVDSEDESSGEASDDSDQDWERSEESDEPPSKRIHTHDEIYRHRFARPNEVLPGDVD
ncbi:hypothetical protein PCASD_13412 [Puccinia coronata f. sp. avenae]|uniref:Uncharacterized protein n=1 Tax=Puccinia coronata f. sp. avenae TaxID=200324 RepID=A0A2N5T0R4_9BASI|nr:hypothetical protein PCASD_13412 [Puccinia coronata f. sp. avenae]